MSRLNTRLEQYRSRFNAGGAPRNQGTNVRQGGVDPNMRSRFDAKPDQGPPKPKKPPAPVAPPPDSPAATQAPPVNPALMDPGYLAATGANQYQYDTTLSGLQLQEGEARQSFGIDDPTNPFSRARELKRLFQQRNQADMTQYASAGQFLSGAYGTAKDESGRDYSKDYDSMSRDYSSLLAGIAQRRGQALVDLSSGNANAFVDALERGLDERDPGDPAAPAPVDVVENPEEEARHARTRRQTEHGHDLAQARAIARAKAKARKKGKK